MATAEEIDAIKDLLPADAESYGWDDDKISQLIDAAVTTDNILLSFWDKVSTSTAGYVDMSESGSSRSLSQVHKNALNMAKLLRDRINTEENPPGMHARTGLRSRLMRRV